MADAPSTPPRDTAPNDEINLRELFLRSPHVNRVRNIIETQDVTEQTETLAGWVGMYVDGTGDEDPNYMARAQVAWDIFMQTRGGRMFIGPFLPLLEAVQSLAPNDRASFLQSAVQQASHLAKVSDAARPTITHASAQPLTTKQASIRSASPELPQHKAHLTPEPEETTSAMPDVTGANIPGNVGALTIRDLQDKDADVPMDTHNDDEVDPNTAPSDPDFQSGDELDEEHDIDTEIDVRTEKATSSSSSSSPLTRDVTHESSSAGAVQAPTSLQEVHGSFDTDGPPRTDQPETDLRGYRTLSETPMPDMSRPLYTLSEVRSIVAAKKASGGKKTLEVASSAEDEPREEDPGPTTVSLRHARHGKSFHANRNDSIAVGGRTLTNVRKDFSTTQDLNLAVCLNDPQVRFYAASEMYTQFAGDIGIQRLRDLVMSAGHLVAHPASETLDNPDTPRCLRQFLIGASAALKAESEAEWALPTSAYAAYGVADQWDYMAQALATHDDGGDGNAMKEYVREYFAEHTNLARAKNIGEAQRWESDLHTVTSSILFPGTPIKTAKSKMSEMKRFGQHVRAICKPTGSIGLILLFPKNCKDCITKVSPEHWRTLSSAFVAAIPKLRHLSYNLENFFLRPVLQFHQMPFNYLVGIMAGTETLADNQNILGLTEPTAEGLAFRPHYVQARKIEQQLVVPADRIRET